MDKKAQITISLSKKEYKIVEEYAHKHGISVPQTIRDTAL